MKRFIGKVVFFLSFCLIIVVVPSYIIDPYNVFHWNNIRNNGVEPNKNYIKTKYILSNPNKYDGFLFGSSRVGSIHVENIPNMKIYNMTYSAGTPSEHYDTLKTFIDNEVTIDAVYMGVDSYSYTEDPMEHNEQGLRAQFQYLEYWPNFINLYIDPVMISQSLSTILKGKKIEGYDAFYEYGWWFDYDIQTSIDWSRAIPSIGKSYRLDETLKEIKDMKDLCNENNIEFIVFANPMYEITYEESIENGNYLEFLERLAEVTDYYNFSGLNNVTISTDNFIDASHYNAYIGDMMIDVMFNNMVDDGLYKQGFGWYVTKDNIDELIKILQ